MAGHPANHLSRQLLLKLARSVAGHNDGRSEVTGQNPKSVRMTRLVHQASPETEVRCG